MVRDANSRGAAGRFSSRRLRTGMVFAQLLLFVSGACAQSAFVRVNQMGYVSGASKRAYLMSSAQKPEPRSPSRIQVAARFFPRPLERTSDPGALVTASFTHSISPTS